MRVWIREKKSIGVEEAILCTLNIFRNFVHGLSDVVMKLVILAVNKLVILLFTLFTL